MLAGGCARDDAGLVHVPPSWCERRARRRRRASRSTTAPVSPPWRSAAATPITATARTACVCTISRPGRAAWRRSADVTMAARLCDALPEIDFVMSGAYPDGMEARRRTPGSSRHDRATTKPLVMTAGGVDTVEPMWRMACALRGGAEELRAKPYFVMYNQPVARSSIPFETVDKLLFCADAGDPVDLLSFTHRRRDRTGHHGRPGNTRPRRGALRSRHAPAARPGRALRDRPGANVLDMATAQSMYNSPEFVRAYACEVEMAKWLDLPNWGFSGHTDAQVIDAQAGMEADQLTKLSMSQAPTSTTTSGTSISGSPVRSRSS